MSVLDLLWQCLQALYEMFFRKIITFPQSNISAVLLSTDATHIGEGAFSLVLKAKDSNSTHNHTKYYAIKRMLLQSTECHLIVKNEIEAFQRFQHPHIIPLLDYVESTEKGRLVMFLLLPYCAQGSLRTVLNTHLQQKGGVIKFTLQEVLYQFQQICEALLVLHQYQPSYVHQDIKPDNVLIDEHGRVFLTDFGSVRKANIAINSRNDSLRVADEAAQFCTASYRSPELYDPPKGTILDSRTDVWAMGCLLFAWWVGYSPFECEFNTADRVKVVECTTLRILSPIPRKAKPSHDDLLMYELCEWILTQQLNQRPFLTDVVARVSKLLASTANGGSHVNMEMV